MPGVSGPKVSGASCRDPAPLAGRALRSFAKAHLNLVLASLSALVRPSCALQSAASQAVTRAVTHHTAHRQLPSSGTAMLLLRENSSGSASTTTLHSCCLLTEGVNYPTTLLTALRPLRKTGARDPWTAQLRLGSLTPILRLALASEWLTFSSFPCSTFRHCDATLSATPQSLPPTAVLTHVNSCCMQKIIVHTCLQGPSKVRNTT